MSFRRCCALSHGFSACIRVGAGAALVLLAVGASPLPAPAQTAAGRPAAGAKAADDVESAVLAASRAYKDALDRGDAAAVKALWTEDGDIIDDLGTVLLGRDAASQISPPAEGEARPAFAIDEATVRVVADDVAIEDGAVTVTPPGSTIPHHGRFSAVWVKRPEGWRLASLREWRTDPPEGSVGVEALDWMVGDWEVEVHGSDEDRGRAPRVTMSVRWNDTRTFLLRETRITPVEGPAVEVTQRIGWDPLTRRIRSWSFSSDGGHSEGVWSLEDGVWVARTMSVLPDGSVTRSINHYVHDGADECTFQSLPTHAGHDSAAETTMTMTRKNGGKKE